MFISSDTIKKLSDKFGKPAEVDFKIEITSEEYDRIKSSQKNGRQHDVTLYVAKDDQWLVNAKHFYPAGMYRSMSGGINPGEDFETGAKREAAEELGCEIELVKFLLLTNAEFYNPDDKSQAIIWHSFVFLANYISGDFNFTDKKEIREVRLATLEDFDKFSEIMRSLDIGGLRYRVALHDTVKKLLTT